MATRRNSSINSEVTLINPGTLVAMHVTFIPFAERSAPWGIDTPDFPHVLYTESIRRGEGLEIDIIFCHSY